MSRFSWLFQTKRSTETTAVFGPLEMSVMDILWTSGESSVRDVIRQLDRPLAYTTVMTTLDRLFKKGLLERRKTNRAFLYSPRFSQPNWQRRRAGELVDGFLSGPHPCSELLISCLVDAVGQRDETLLDELERRIQQRRKDIINRKSHGA